MASISQDLELKIKIDSTPMSIMNLKTLSSIKLALNIPF